MLPWVWPLAIYSLFVLPRLPHRIALLGCGALIDACGVVATCFNRYEVRDYCLGAIFLPLWLSAAGVLWGVADRLRGTILRRLIPSATLALMVIAASRWYMVQRAYGHFAGHELLAFRREVRGIVPADRDLVIVGDDWNPRVPDYTQRRAFMAWSVLPDAAVRDYVAENGLRDLVVCRSGDTAALGLLPDSELVLGGGHFELRRQESPAR